MEFRNKIFIFILLLIGTVTGQSQTTATASLDTNAILIGDQTGLELNFTCPPGYKVKWPVIGDTLITHVEIVNRTGVDTALNNDKSGKIYHQRLNITSFDSGYYAIPPFRIRFKQPGDTTTHFTETEPLLLHVKTVPVDMKADIKGLKSLWTAPFTFREALPYILLVIGVGLITFFIIYYLRKRKKAEPIFRGPPKPKLPPHQIALDALETLRNKKLWQNGHVKEYHTELIDIIRNYLLGRFNIHALEYTSDEIMESVESTAANEQAKAKLRQSLVMADMVKFAKMKPLPVEHDTSLNNCIDFVRETMHLVPEEQHEISPKEKLETEDKVTAEKVESIAAETGSSDDHKPQTGKEEADV